MTEDVQSDQQSQEQYLQQAQDFFGQSMGRIKGQMQSDSAQLQSFMQQLPEESQQQVQQMTDSYEQFGGTIDQAAQDAGVQDSLEEAAQQAREQADQAAGQDPTDVVADQAGQVADQAGQVAGQAQDAVGGLADQAQGAVDQAQDTVGELADSLPEGYQAVGQPFTDQQGNQVQQGQDEEGNTVIVQRTEDEQGNVVDTIYDQQGNLIDEVVGAGERRETSQIADTVDLDTGNIRLHEREPVSTWLPLLARRDFAIEVGNGAVLGDFIVDSESQTVVWDGAVAFDELGHAVLEELPARIWETQAPAREDFVVAVALFRSSGEVIEGILGDNVDEDKHRELLRKPEEIVAARYDVAVAQQGVVTSPFEYAVTAENLIFTQGLSTATSWGFEITLQLPLRKAWTPGLVAWVVEHHPGRETLPKSIDFAAAAKTLTDRPPRRSINFSLRVETLGAPTFGEGRA